MASWQRSDNLNCDRRKPTFAAGTRSGREATPATLEHRSEELSDHVPHEQEERKCRVT